MLVSLEIVQKKLYIIVGWGGGRIWSLWRWFLKEEDRPRTFNSADLLARMKRWKDTREDLVAFLLAPDSTPYLNEMGWTPLGRAAITLLSSLHPRVHTDIPVWWRSLRESQAGSPPSAAGPPWLTFLCSYPLASLGSRACCVSGDRTN